MIEFDAETHTYTRNGIVVPSVTQIIAPLQDFSGIDPEVLDRAAEFGTHVHEAIALELAGDLDRDSLDPALAPYVDAALQWIDEVNGNVIGFEEVVYSERYGFAGMKDLDIEIPVGRRCERTLADWKTGVVMPRSVGPQLAGYEIASTTRATKYQARVCVELTANGYRAHRQRDYALHKTVFLACRIIHHYINGTKADERTRERRASKG